MKKISLLFFYLLILFSYANAQSPVITQYGSVPLIVNPANTGNYQGGKFRAGVSFAHLTNGAPDLNYFGAITNNFYNVGLEYKIGKQNKWAAGLNYLHVSSPRNMFTQKFHALSLAREFSFDKQKNYTLRLGAQAVYASGVVDESKGGYSILLDARGFEYFRPADTLGAMKFSSEYFNLHMGANFNIRYDFLHFSTGVSVQNVLRPDFGIMYGRSVDKRIALNFESSLTFLLSNIYSLRFSHFTYKEGVYFREAPGRFDSADINETIYGVTLHKSKKTTHSIGFLTRSVKTAIVQGSIDLYKGLTASLSYELPLQNAYYPISQYGISLVYQPGIIHLKMKDVTKKKTEIQSKTEDIQPIKRTEIFCLTDRDKDGIADSLDVCPDTVGLLKFKGCPVSPDNVSEAVEKAVNKYSHTDTISSAHLHDSHNRQNENLLRINSSEISLIMKDSDRDGISDSLDICPDVPGVLALNGCPETKGDLDYSPKIIYFKSGSSILNELGKNELNLLAEYLGDHPEVRLIIHGHADNTGSESLNQRLSLQRAKSARNYLKSQRVASDRMKTYGFGYSRPAADNSTGEGRSKNRRVELKVKK